MKKKITIFALIFAAAVFFLFFLNAKTGLFSKTPYDELIEGYSSRFELDPLLVKALMKRESNAKPSAVSSKGAVGLMQIMPKTAFEISNRLGVSGFSEDMLKNPEVNIMFGSFYLKELIAYYGGNLILALAAYNAGIGNVDNWLSQTPAVASKISKMPFKETRRHVRAILFTYKLYKIKK